MSTTTHQHAPFLADGYPCIVHRRNDCIHGTWEAFCPELGLQSRHESRGVAIDMLKAAVHHEAEQRHPRIESPDTQTERAARLLRLHMIALVGQQALRQDMSWPDLMAAAGLSESLPLADLSAGGLNNLVRLATALGCEWRVELMPTILKDDTTHNQEDHR